MAGCSDRPSDLDDGGEHGEPDVPPLDPMQRLMRGPFHRATIAPPASAVIGCRALPGLLPRE
jgi:hypothetical protein